MLWYGLLDWSPRILEADCMASLTSIVMGTITWQHDIFDLSVVPKKSLTESRCQLGFWMFDSDQ